MGAVGCKAIHSTHKNLTRTDGIETKYIRIFVLVKEGLGGFVLFPVIGQPPGTAQISSGIEMLYSAQEEQLCKF